MVPYDQRSDNFGTRTYIHMAADLNLPSNRDLLENQTITANLGGWMYHDTIRVWHHKAYADLGVYWNVGSGDHRPESMS